MILASNRQSVSITFGLCGVKVNSRGRKAILSTV